MKKKFLGILFSVVMLIASLLFISCGGDSFKLGKPENVSYDGMTITWNKVEKADKYTVRINDGEEWPVTVNSYAYESNSEFSVTITAVAGSSKVVKSGTTTVNFKPLAAITEVRFNEEGEASWDPVDSADGYKVKLNGVELNDVYTEPFFNDWKDGERNSIQVRPVVRNNKSYYSKWSKVQTITKLGQVDKDSISYANNVITWNAVTGAAGYEVSVNGQKLDEKIVGNSVNYVLGDAKGDFNVSVKALGNGANTFSGTVSETKTFIFLDMVENIRVESGVLLWDAVSEATGYKLKLNGNVYSETITGCEFNKLTANVSTTIQVMPINSDNTYFSDWSAAYTVLILPAPVLQWNDSMDLDGQQNNNIYWDGIANAVGYTVRIVTPDGKEEHDLGETDRSYAHDYAKIGTYTVELRANAQKGDGSVVDSIFSTPITIIRLAPPTVSKSDYLQSNPDDLSKGFTVNFDSVSGAKGYVLYQDNNKVQESTANQFRVTEIIGDSIIEEQTLNYKIQSKGSISRSQGKIVVNLDSLSESSYAFAITVLAVPSTPDISGYTYSYGKVEKATGYAVDIGGKSYVSNNVTYDLSNLEAGNYSVRVCARGNGSNILASNYTGPIDVYRLEAPTNIRIATSDESEGRISCTLDLHADSAVVVFNNNGVAIPADDIKNINQYVTEQGTTVYMQAIANKFSADRKTYYMTSRPSPTEMFTMLAAPTFGDVKFTNTQFIWKAPSNMNANVYTPTYEVYNAAGRVYNGDKNGTTMNIADFKGGEQYVFQVKAIGNGTNYINSAKSEAVSIYKLATPEVKRENGQYTWKGVADAVSYAVYVDGKLMETFTHRSGQTYAYTPKFTEVGTYTVEIFAIGDNGYRSIDSTPNTIEQVTKQLDTPDFKFSYNKDAYENDGQLVATITKESPYANGYYYTIAGATVYSKESTYAHKPNSTGTFYGRVYAAGGNFDENGIFYVDSQSAGGQNNSSYEIILLDTPNPSNWNLTEDGKLTWTAVSNAIGYEVEVTVNGVKRELQTLKTNTLFLTDVTENDTITIRIRATGNSTMGGNIVASAWVTRTW